MGKNIGFIALIVSIIVALVIGFICAGILMWLWNIIIPTIFSLPMISYWQAFGIYIISNILFKSSSFKTKTEE
jgi:hypothetical protein